MMYPTRTFDAVCTSITFAAVSAALMTWRRWTCGYSIAWYPFEYFCPASDVTTARTTYSPLFVVTGAVTTNFADNDSSSVRNWIGAEGGTAFHPSGSSSETEMLAGPFVLLVTDTKRSRLTAFGAVA